MTDLERVARAICDKVFDGYDPDEVVSHKPPPSWIDDLPDDPSAPEHLYYSAEGEDWIYQWKRWRLYIPAAKAAIAALSPSPSKQEG